MTTLKKRLRECPPQPPSDGNKNHLIAETSTEMLARTPASNTGLDSQTGFTVGLDWLDITFRQVPDISEVWEIVSEVEALLGDEIDFSATRPIFNGKEWDGSGKGLEGVLLFYDAGCDDDGMPSRSPALKVAMSGSVIGNANQLAIAFWLNGRAEKNDLECTRIDISLDDHDKSVELWKITEAKRAGNFFNASWSAYMESGKRGDDVGVTLYFGSPKSDKRLRIYDKTIESKGAVIGNRWEAEFRRKAANVALYQWIEASLENEDSVTNWCKNTVTGVIDFRNRSSDDPNRYRCPLLKWFASFVKRLQSAPCRIRVPKPIVTVQKSIDWVTKAVAPTLALLKKVLTDDFDSFLQEQIYEGGVRLSNVRRKLIESVSRGELIY